MFRRQYSTFEKERKVFLTVVAAVILAVIIAIGSVIAQGEEPMATVYAMCRPESKVWIRREPKGDSQITGYLDCGDPFQTDGESRDGWIRCYGAGENGWVYIGYVAENKPEVIDERYVCVAIRQVACRQYINGPLIDDRPWLRNGEFCTVYITDGEWAVTSRGYIKIEWLEVSPE